jgi:Phosphotransferase enzyme family
MKRIVQQIVVGGGHTPSQRRRVVFDDGSRAFVKQAVDADTARWLRKEARVYQALAGQPFVPAVLEWRDDPGGPALPALVLEDLGDAAWPPPWSQPRIEATREALGRVHAHPAPDWLEPRSLESLAGWHVVAGEPEPFLGLGWCTRAWLERNLPALSAAEATVPDEAAVLSHLDLRGDNICFAGSRTVLVDWSWAARAPLSADLALWAVSLGAEHGTAPERLSVFHPSWPARMAGLFASRAGLPPPPDAPGVRAVQRRQLAVALRWASRALDVAPPDGPAWRDEP